MRALDRKLLRDLQAMKGQVLAISLLVGCAVATYVGSTSTYRSLIKAQAVYYERYRFPDVFAELRRAPSLLEERIGAIPGVAVVETRLIADAAVELDGFSEPAMGRLVSIPSSDEPRMNGLHLREGSLPERGSLDEVLVSDGFAAAHGLHGGSTLGAVVQGQRIRLRIVGIALSPEFIYQIRPGEAFPDDRHFCILWMRRASLERQLAMQGAFNSASLRLARGAREAEVIASLDRLLGSYGGTGAYARSNHDAHRFISDEIRQLQVIATVMPGIFLGVAAFLLSVVISRLVGIQRQQIGTLKALGFSGLEVGLHFSKFAVLIVAAGALLGIGGGYLMGSSLTGLYTNFYKFPVLLFELPLDTVVKGSALALLFAVGGAASSVLRAVKLQAAEAMRPEPPATFRASLLERIGLGSLLSPMFRMVLRNLGRRAGRAALAVVGLGAAVGILIVGFYLEDSMSFLVDLQFRFAQREDLAVGFTAAQPAAAASELRDLPGVRAVEPFRAVPCILRSGARSYRLGLLGLVPDADLHRIIDAKGRQVPLPSEGVLLSVLLAKKLDVSPGAWLRVEVLDGKRPIRAVQVAGLVDDLLGLSATMWIDPLNRLARTEGQVTGAFVSVDPTVEDAVYARLKGIPKVSGVTLLRAARKSFERTSAEYLLFFSSVLVGFAVIIAAGVVYNTARISLAERERELATFRVIGFTQRETFLVVLGEMAILSLLAIPVGCGIGYGFAAISSRLMASELFRIPLVVDPSTFGKAALIVGLATVLVALLVRRRIDRLDLVSVLKSKE